MDPSDGVKDCKGCAKELEKWEKRMKSQHCCFTCRNFWQCDRIVSRVLTYSNVGHVQFDTVCDCTGGKLPDQDGNQKQVYFCSHGCREEWIDDEHMSSQATVKKAENGVDGSKSNENVKETYPEDERHGQ